MTIYYAAFGLIFFYSLLFKPQRSQTGKKQFVLFAFFTLFLLGALRADTVGNDLEIYKPFFYTVKQATFREVMCGMETMDWGYGILNKIISLFTDHFFVFKAIALLITLAGVAITIYLRSEDVFISTWAYIMMFYYMLSFSAIRQMLALSFLFIAFLFIEKKSLFYFSIFVIVAALFHKSAIIFFPVYFLRYVKINIKTMYLYFVGTVGLLGLYDVLETHVFLKMDRFNAYFIHADKFQINLSGILNIGLRIGIVLICLVFAYKAIKRKPQNAILIHILLCLCVFQIFSIKNSALSRLPTYFFPFIILYLPEISQILATKEQKRFMNVIMVSALLCYFFIYYEFSTAQASGVEPYISLLSDII